MSNPLLNIAFSAGEVVVQANHFLVRMHQAINQVRAEKTSSASDQIAHGTELIGKSVV
jgi:hypothetical protein